MSAERRNIEEVPANNPWNRQIFQATRLDPLTQKPETPQVTELRLEMEHFNAIVKSFSSYGAWQKARFARKEDDWQHLPEKYLSMIPNMKQKFKFITWCLDQNQQFLDEIVKPSILQQMMGTDHLRFPCTNNAKPMDLDKVKSTLRQCIRDWSKQGEAERNMSYKPILDKLAELYKPNQRSDIRILNPGCGLGRLTWEIAFMGFQSQGNEFSYHMLLCSNLIINCAQKVEEFTIYPHIDQVANVWRFRDQCRKITFPDVYPRNLPESANFTMIAGDFLDVYTDADSWDVVVTCFFIDTAKNIFDYLAAMAKIIPYGGYWINMGPLLYHFEEMNEASVELTYEELRAIIPQYGFDFVHEDLGVSCTYSRNELSMLQMAYNSVFFVCKRVQRSQHGFRNVQSSQMNPHQQQAPSRGDQMRQRDGRRERQGNNYSEPRI